MKIVRAPSTVLPATASVTTVPVYIFIRDLHLLQLAHCVTTDYQISEKRQLKAHWETRVCLRARLLCQ